MDTYAGFVLKFLFAVAITRILTPRDYGIVAYTGLFMAIAIWLSEGGFGAALIQKQDVDQVDYSTAWFFNLGVSLLFFILYFASARFVADYFHEPALKWVLRVASVNLLLNAVCYVHTFKLIKAINFRPQALINFSSSLLSGMLGLFLALSGLGYWSLVIMTLSGSLFRLTGYSLATRWRPSLVFSVRSFREQFRFASRVFAQGLLESIFREVYSLVIGKMYNTASLGLYSRGYKFYDLFINKTGTALNKVLYPTMALRSPEKYRHQRSYFRFYDLLFYLTAPLSLLLILMAQPIVIGLLTRKWLGAVPYMKLYLVAGFIFNLIYFNTSTLLSLNRPKQFLKLDITQKALFVLALITTYRWGIPAIIAGWLIVYYIYYFIYEWNMFKLGLAGRAKYLNMLKSLLSLLPCVLVFLGIKLVFHETRAAFLLQAIVFPITYLAISRIFGVPAYKDLAGILRPSLPHKMKWIL